MMRRAAALAAWVGLLLAALALLLRAGTVLPSPPPLEANAVVDWLTTTDPVAVVVVALRAAGLTITGYLLATTLAGTAARLSRLPRLVASTDAVTLPSLCRFLQRTVAPKAVSTGLAASIALAGPAATFTTVTATTAFASPATHHELAAASSPAVSPADTEHPPVMEVLEAPTLSPFTPEPSATAEEGSPSTTWIIQSGEHLWHVATVTLTRAWARPPTDAETVTYLHELIQLNADRLVVPGEPDLVFPGQVFDLPPVPR